MKGVIVTGGVTSVAGYQYRSVASDRVVRTGRATVSPRASAEEIAELRKRIREETEGPVAGAL